MSKLITYIPLSSVERIELRVTNCRKTLSQVKSETGAHYVLNGGMWNPDGSACPLLKVGGVMRSGTPWRTMGYAWDKGPGHPHDLRVRGSGQLYRGDCPYFLRRASG